MFNVIITIKRFGCAVRKVKKTVDAGTLHVLRALHGHDNVTVVIR